MTLKIAIGADHGGFALKETLKHHLKTNHPNTVAIDCGTHTEASVDYPDFADKVAKIVLSKEADVGILICGTGIGISIKANRYIGIRAALLSNPFMAQMAKEHNNANIVCLGARTTTPEDAKTFIDTWLNATFEGGRHQLRLDKLDVL